MIKRVFNNFLKLVSLRIVLSIFPIFLIPFYIKLLGLETYSYFAIFQVASAIAIVVVRFGFSMSASRLVARNDCSEYHASILHCVFNLSLKVFFVTIPVLFIYFYFVDIVYLHFFLYMFLFCLLRVVFEGLLPEWYYLGKERLNTVLFARLFGQCIYFFTVLLFLKIETGLVFIMFFWMLSSAITFFLVMLNLYYKCGVSVKSMPDGFDKKNFLKDSLDIFMSNLSVSFYTMSGVIFLSFFSTPQNAGLYRAIEEIIRGGNQVLQCFSTVLYPFVNKRISEQNKNLNDLFNKLLMVAFSVPLIPTILIIFHPEMLAEIIFDTYSNKELLVIRIMVCITPIISVSNIFAVQGLISHGFNRVFLKITILSATSHIILMLILTPTFNLIGATSTLLFTESLICFLSFICYRKYIIPKLKVCD